MPGVNCISACLTRDHETWGECRRANGLRVAYCQSAAGKDYTQQKKWDKNLDGYAKARKEGIQPKTTWPADVNTAVRRSDETGTAYRARPRLIAFVHTEVEERVQGRGLGDRLIRFALMLGMSEQTYARVMNANLRLMKKLGRA